MKKNKIISCVIWVIVFAILLTVGVMAKPQSKNIIALMYHDLTNEPATADENPSWTTTGEKFEKDIQTFLDSGYIPLTVEKYAKGDYEPDQKYFIVTFDDGYLSNYTIAFPILEKLDVTADIFINTSWTMRYNHFRYYQGNIMESSGLVKIYSHMPSHVYVGEVEHTEFIKQAKNSFEKLSKSLTEKEPREKIFSYPGGIYTEESFNGLKTEGVILQIVQNPPEFECEQNEILVRRNVEYHTDISKFIKESHEANE